MKRKALCHFKYGSLLVTLCATPFSNAADFIWDPELTGTGSDGAGTWDNITANWSSAGASTPFVSLPAAAVVRKTVTDAAASGSTELVMNDVTDLVVGQEFSLTQFPTGTAITAIDTETNTITLSAPSTGNINANTNNVDFQLPHHNAIFGVGSGAAGSVVLDSAQNARHLTLNAAGSGNYSFSGADLTLGSVRPESSTMTVNSGATFSNVVNASNGNNNRLQFATEGQTLGFSGGGSILAMGSGSGIHGTNSTVAKSSTIEVTGGTYTGIFGIWNIGDGVAGTGGMQFSGADTVSNINIIQVGNSGNGNLSVTDGAQIKAADQVSVGRNGSGNAGKFTVDGGSFTANGGAVGQAMVQVGRDRAIGSFDQKAGRTEIIGNGITNTGGGVLVLNSTNRTDANGSGTLNVSGGTMVVKDIRFNGTNQHHQNLSNAGHAELNLSGGSLYIGGTVMDNTSQNTEGVGEANGDNNFMTQGGISDRGVGLTTFAINMSGGTLGANADWSSSLDMSLVSGNTNLKAADENDVAHTITLSGMFSGSGGFTKTGAGILELSGTGNSYTGDTFIAEGTLVASSENALGVGNISLGDAILILGNANAIDDNASLIFDFNSIINLDYTGTEFLASITDLSSNTTLSSGGNYDADWLNDYFDTTAFTGTGLISFAAIPEPSSAALFGMSLISLLLIRKRRTS